MIMYSIVWVFVFILHKLLTMFNKKVLVYSWFVLLKGRLCGYPRFHPCRGSVIDSCLLEDVDSLWSILLAALKREINIQWKDVNRK